MKIAACVELGQGKVIEEWKLLQKPEDGGTSYLVIASLLRAEIAIPLEDSRICRYEDGELLDGVNKVVPNKEHIEALVESHTKLYYLGTLQISDAILIQDNPN